MAAPYGNIHLRSVIAQSKFRIQNVAVKTQVNSGNKLILWGLVVSNANAAAQTVTLLEGSTTEIVLHIPAGVTVVIPMNCGWDDLEITPSDAALDILVLYTI